MERTRAGDGAARWLGLVAFVLGIVLLGIVFMLAYRDLTATGVLAQAAGPPPAGSPAPTFEASLIPLVIKAVLFFVMAYTGSAIAGRGIGLYGVSRSGDEG